ncbi:hypothetical protein J2W49_005177 [Hydrogenophaga palleronii]|uniref:Uncharacterized protein n=1 Tax=Hydrogenophaga palleronii TaxID=65655 RepID=A0ABU1WWF9_9BURK|nr:hypothetical protein [Hydrogenophaga palleronii]MDR7153197.1 hypothetical protein [Hydrogenophaga palleronii]
MNFDFKPLSSTWFAELDLRGMVEPSRIPEPVRHANWMCAANHVRGILCTQLISSTPEMREGWYWYLFAVRTRLYVLRSGDGQVRVEKEGVSGSLALTPRSYSGSKIVSMGIQAIHLLHEASSRPNGNAPTILDANGKPLVRAP